MLLFNFNPWDDPGQYHVERLQMPRLEVIRPYYPFRPFDAIHGIFPEEESRLLHPRLPHAQKVAGPTRRMRIVRGDVDRLPDGVIWTGRAIKSANYPKLPAS